MILCDTNILIEIFKGNTKTISDIEKFGIENICISSITAMELLFGALNKKELINIKKNIGLLKTIHLNEEISKISLSLIESYSKSHNLQIPDAIIAATAISENIQMFTYNLKDFKYIKNLNLY